MHGYVTSVDWEWYQRIGSIAAVDEVNLWRPGIRHHFRAIVQGEPVFFRLKSPRDRIAGFGFLAHFSILPVSLAWRVFREANGEASYGSMRGHLLQLREQLDMKREEDREDPQLGCILLRRVVLLDEEAWVAPPRDLDDHAGHGKRYDLGVGEGKRLWSECARHIGGPARSEDGPAILSSARYGPASFRVAVFDAWGRRCAVTGEGVAVALDAARFSPDIPGSFSLTNGILLRADLARLLEAGYVTVTPDHILLVSSSMGTSETGRDYQRLHGTGIRLPTDAQLRPDPELLWWHRRERFMGE